MKMANNMPEMNEVIYNEFIISILTSRSVFVTRRVRF